jgi:hypothetical protein
MPRISRKNRTKNRNHDFQNIPPQVERATINKPNMISQTYDASKSIKKDLVWSGLTAGIVVVVLIIFYVFLR